MTLARLSSPIGRLWNGYAPLVVVVPLVVVLALIFWIVELRALEDRRASLPRDLMAADGEVREHLDGVNDFLADLVTDLQKNAISEVSALARATRYTNSHPEVRSIWRLSDDLRLQWVAGGGGDLELVGSVITINAVQAAAAHAKESGRHAYTGTYVSGRDERIIASIQPFPSSFPGGGHLLAEISFEGMVSAALPPWIKSHYSIAFLGRNDVILARQPLERPVDPTLRLTAKTDITGHGLFLSIERYAEGPDWETLVLGSLCAGVTLGVGIAVTELSRDIRRRRRLIEEMANARRLAELASDAKSRFLAHVSHEIRTPIGAVIGYADLLLDPPPENQEFVDGLAAIRRNGQTLLSLVNDLLDLSKVEAGLLNIEPSTICLRKELEGALDSVAPQANVKGLELKLTADSPVPATVRTDPLRLRQILVNLLSNAIKFTEHGRIQIGVALQVVGGATTKVSVDVRDEGIGIAPEAQQRLFQPFSQGSTSTARRYGGTGLGLSLARELARLLGGDVVLVDSAPGRGTTFRFSFDPGPLAGVSLEEWQGRNAVEVIEPQTYTPPRGRLAKTKILVVEDSPDIQIILRENLQSEGADVVIAADGSAALQRAREGFQLVIMDIQLPGLDGYETTKRLRNHGFTGPVIALTANAIRGERERCLAAGCNDYLVKPIPRAALVTALAGWVHQSRHAPSDVAMH